MHKHTMFRLSNCLFFSFNLLALASGSFAIGSSLHFQTHGVTACHKVLHHQLLVMGIILLVMSLVGLIGTICRFTFLLWIYSVVAFLIIVCLTVFTVFVYIVNNPSASKSLSGIGFKEHRLGDYSEWLHNTVSNGKRWNAIRACLIDHQICNGLALAQDAEDVRQKKLSPVESGCCKPPVHCGYEYKNATFWTLPTLSVTESRDPDCTLWRNGQEKLCYDCNSCKAGVLDMSRLTWKIFFILDAIDVAIIVIIFALSCCTWKNVKSYEKYNGINTSYVS